MNNQNRSGNSGTCARNIIDIGWIGARRKNLGSPIHQSSNPPLHFLAAVLLLATAGRALAGTHCVDVNSANPTPPYTNWATAATNIQDAVGAAAAGDEIVVTNGVYAPVWISKAVLVRSVNGPLVTQINGRNSVGCAEVASGATLSGFTLTNGLTYGGGGGVSCDSLTAVVSNCVIGGNSATAYGGGAYGGTLLNCTLTGNWAYYGGGGAYDATLSSCALASNNAYY